mmetsp:Transcript_87869/g.268886  ORF Transcript_87869/g.268886 Transcript_87869/m.268886 type:complete len:258 (-) Transcript_87869:329-1102(-)
MPPPLPPKSLPPKSLPPKALPPKSLPPPPGWAIGGTMRAGGGQPLPQPPWQPIFPKSPPLPMSPPMPASPPMQPMPKSLPITLDAGRGGRGTPGGKSGSIPGGGIPGRPPPPGGTGARGSMLINACALAALAAALQPPPFDTRMASHLSATIFSPLRICSAVPGPIVTVAGMPLTFWSIWILHPAWLVMSLMCSPPRPIRPPTYMSSTCSSFAGICGPDDPPGPTSVYGPPILSLISRSASFKSDSLCVALVTIAKL